MVAGNNHPGLRIFTGIEGHVRSVDEPGEGIRYPGGTPQGERAERHRFGAVALFV
ncbi:hypothetical protein Sm713_21070 [Streptomyces sp. TS71-3]|nr:hypothetical protein Sm713_21070 [Streptomyces sp. TS71-3]